MKRKILSWVLCLCMALTWIPASALAAGGEDTPSASGNEAVSVTKGQTTTKYNTFKDAWTAATDASGAVDVAITLLKSVTEEDAVGEYSINSSAVKSVTLNIPQGMTLTLNKGFYVRPGNLTLTINGNPENGTDAAKNGKLIVSGGSNPGGAAVQFGSDSDVTDEQRATVNIQNCTITAHGIPGVAAGDGNITISRSQITSDNDCATQNWNAAVTVTPNTGVATTLNVTGSTLTGKHGLYIGEGVTATVANSTITGQTGGCGVMLSYYHGDGKDTTLTVTGISTITAPGEGVIIQKGTLDFQGGTITTSTSTTDMSVRGIGVYLDGDNGGTAARKAIVGGKIEARQGICASYNHGENNEITVKSGADIEASEYGIWLQGGTAKINGGSIQATGVRGTGAYVTGGKAVISGGSIQAGSEGGTGVSVESGTAEISGSVKINGMYAGVNVYPQSGSSANVSISGGAIEASGEYGTGLAVNGGTVTLSGGTYSGNGEAVTATASGVKVKDLLKSGFAYYRVDGKIITTAEMDQYQTTLGDVRTATVKAGDPSAAPVEPANPEPKNVSLISGGAFGLSWEYPENSSLDRADVGIKFVSENGNNEYLTDKKSAHEHGTFTTTTTPQNKTIHLYELNDPELASSWPAGNYKGIVQTLDTGGQEIFKGETQVLNIANLTRADAAVMLNRYGKPQATPAELPGDCNGLLADQKTAVQAVLGANWMDPTAEGTFSPNALVTNNQLAALICRAKGWGYTLENAVGVLAEKHIIQSAQHINGDDSATNARCETWIQAALYEAPAVTNVTKAPGDTNSGLTVRYENGTAYLTGTLEYPNSSTLMLRVLLTAVTEEGTVTATLSVYRDDTNAILPVGPCTLSNGGTFGVDVTGLTARIAGSGTGTGSGTGSGSGSGSSSGSSGGSSSSSSGGSSSSSTKNPDGSTTTKTENKTTGTVTETTKNTDGSKTVVETKKDGTVTTTETDKSGNKTQTVEKPDGSAVTTVSRKDGTSATVTTDASGKTEAQVNLPAAAVSAAKDSGEAVTLPIPEVRASRDPESAPTVTVKTGSSGAVKVEIPARNVTPGTVAVLVQADGTETVLKTTVPTEGGVAVALPDGATVKLVDNSKTFSDVASGHWAEEAVEFVTAREMFSGTTAETFTPQAPMTRAMLMTVLARFDGTDTNGGSVWYEKGMAWAVEKGVSDGSNPNGQITREQLAAMLWRYSGSPSPKGSLNNFTDGASVSGYAQEAMSWAVENGILNGFGDGRLGPQGQATRAQVAQMLKNFVTSQK